MPVLRHPAVRAVEELIQERAEAVAEVERLREAITEHRHRTQAMAHVSHAAYIDADLWAALEEDS